MNTNNTTTKSTEKMTNFRWGVCALLFIATTINYLDRQALSLTWRDFIAPQFHWNDSHYGIVTGYFSLIYACCMLFAGKIIDKLGSKSGYQWAISIWSAAACLHAICGWATVHIAGLESSAALKTIESGSAMALAVASISTWLFLGCRCLLAAGEAGNFPAAVKAAAEYFPAKDRAFATSIFNAGSSAGALAAPLMIPLLAKYWGWEAAFLVVGSLGFLWMGLWGYFYRAPEVNPRVNKAELNYIRQDILSEPTKTEKKLSILRAFTLRQTWALLLERLVTDGVWWFFLFWTPSYLSDRYGYTSSSTQGMVLITHLYAIVSFLSIFLCKIPTYLVEKRGRNPYEARLLSMFFFACLPLLAILAQPLGDYSAWWPAIIIGIACAGHQAWSANIYAAVGDMFDRCAIGTVTGIAGLAAGCGSFIVNYSAGRLFTYSDSLGAAFTFMGYSGKEAGYMIVFCYCSVAYLIGWACMKILVPRYMKVEI